MSAPAERGPAIDQTELFDAIAREQIEVWLQPMVELRTSTALRFEALARWTHATAGEIVPGDFIPLAAQSGLITPLTLVVLRKSAAALHRLRADYPSFAVAINLAQETLHWPGLEQAIREALTAEGCPLSALALEITETALMSDPEAVRRTVRPLRAEGVRIHLNDFGAAYSSLGQLAELELDAVKIDRQLVAGVTAEGKHQTIVRAMIGLAHDLGLEAIAQGVENSATWELLLEMGCDGAQGYHVARPMPESYVREWISSWAAGVDFVRRAGIGQSVLSATGAPAAPPRERSIAAPVEDGFR